MNVVRNALRSTSPPPDGPRDRPKAAAAPLKNEGRSFPAGASLTASRPVWSLLAEETRGLEHEDKDQNPKDHGLGPLWVDQKVREGRDYPNQQPTDERAANIADAAHHRGGEGVKAVSESLKEPGG